jgi:hypothetical protein
MNTLLKRLAGCTLLLTVLLTGAYSQAASLTLNPADISQSPGMTTGWGFTLSNDANYMVVTSTDFTATISLGSFTDLLGLQYLVLEPNDSITQAFDTMSGMGLGKFVISPDTICGQMVMGLITLNYDLYSVSPNDPSFNPDADFISSGNSLDANASVSVVPEPGTVMLMAAILPAFLAGRRRVLR